MPKAMVREVVAARTPRNHEPAERPQPDNARGKADRYYAADSQNIRPLCPSELSLDDFRSRVWHRRPRRTQNARRTHRSTRTHRSPLCPPPCPTARTPAHIPARNRVPTPARIAASIAAPTATRTPTLTPTHTPALTATLTPSPLRPGTRRRRFPRPSYPLLSRRVTPTRIVR